MKNKTREKNSRIRFVLALFLLMVAIPVARAEDLLTDSQARFEDENFDAAKARYFLRLQARGLRVRRGSALDSAIPARELRFEDVPLWDGSLAFDSVFRTLRDDRFLWSTGSANDPRRISWLYPDDGCFARAAMSESWLTAHGFSRTRKLFAFGRLAVSTPNSPRGAVYWWYHVVPAVRVGGDVVIVDPAVEPGRPLAFAEWLSRIASDPDSVRVSLCGTFAYAPASSCLESGEDEESGAWTDEKYYLRAEYRRLVALGRDTDQELGDNPPWLGTKVD